MEQIYEQLGAEKNIYFVIGFWIYNNINDKRNLLIVLQLLYTDRE